MDERKNRKDFEEGSQDQGSEENEKHVVPQGTPVVADAEFQARLNKYCLMDDVYFRAFMRDNYSAAQLMLGIILQKNVEVTQIETQRDLKNLKGRSLTIDFYGKADGKPVDVEVQNGDAGADYRRARYHSSLLDADSLKPGDNFDELPDTYVVFITENDIPGYGDACYLITRHIQSRQELIHDGSYIIYVNGQYRGDDEFGHLMHDFHCTKPEEMYYGILQTTARNLKETEKGAAKVMSESERLIQVGITRHARESAEKMIRANEPDWKIIDYTGLTQEQVEKVKASVKEKMKA